MGIAAPEQMPRRGQQERIWIIVTQVERRGGQVTKLPHFAEYSPGVDMQVRTNHPYRSLLSNVPPSRLRSPPSGGLQVRQRLVFHRIRMRPSINASFGFLFLSSCLNGILCARSNGADELLRNQTILSLL